MGDAALADRSAWAGLARPGRFGAPGGEPGVVIVEVAAGPMFLLAARRGDGASVARAAGRSGVALPTTPAFVRQGDRLVLWAGPDQWWVRGAITAAMLASEFAGLDVSVVDLGQARACLGVSGARVRDALAKGFEIDLHPRAFKTGDVALTTVANVPTAVWQTDDHPTYAIAVPRSYAGSFWHWLTGAAAEYGYRVEVDGEDIRPA